LQPRQLVLATHGAGNPLDLRELRLIDLLGPRQLLQLALQLALLRVHFIEARTRNERAAVLRLLG
jgi:hypothetical protein